MSVHKVIHMIQKEVMVVCTNSLLVDPSLNLVVTSVLLLRFGKDCTLC